MFGNIAEPQPVRPIRSEVVAITYRAGVVLALIVEWLKSLGDTT
jgi:hypothetical protein